MSEVIRCPSGWMVIGTVGKTTVRIAVVGSTSAEAEYRFTAAVKAWEDSLSLLRASRTKKAV
jgi:hypothetical protein